MKSFCSHHIFLVVIIIGLHITVEVRGYLLDGNTTRMSERSLRDYPYPGSQSLSLIHNPNIRTKPVNRARKDDDCTDEILRKVMNEHISDAGMTDSKRGIHAAARRDFEGSWSVICAPCAFSYLAHAQEFCVHSKHGITCLLYRDG